MSHLKLFTETCLSYWTLHQGMTQSNRFELSKSSALEKYVTAQSAEQPTGARIKSDISLLENRR